MPRVPVPLTWKRRHFAVLEPMGTVDRLYAVAVTGWVGGPFAIYAHPVGSSFNLIHLPTQTKILDMDLLQACKDAAEMFAALDVNWWSCIREEIVGTDTQEIRNVYDRLKPGSFIYRADSEAGL